MSKQKFPRWHGTHHHRCEKEASPWIEGTVSQLAPDRHQRNRAQVRRLQRPGFDACRGLLPGSTARLLFTAAGTAESQAGGDGPGQLAVGPVFRALPKELWLQPINNPCKSSKGDA